LITNGGEIITAGTIASPQYKPSEFSMQKSRLRNLENKNVCKMLVRARLDSPNYPQVIKIFDQDYIDVKVGIKAKINANTK